MMGNWTSKNSFITGIETQVSNLIEPLGTPVGEALCSLPPLLPSPALHDDAIANSTRHRTNDQPSTSALNLELLFASSATADSRAVSLKCSTHSYQHTNMRHHDCINQLGYTFSRPTAGLQTKVP